MKNRVSGMRTMFDLLKIIIKKLYGAIFIVLLFSLYYIYTIVSFNIEEREKIIKDYDFQDNHSDYFVPYVDTDSDGFQQLIGAVEKKLYMRDKVKKLNKKLKDLTIPEKIIRKVPLVMVVQVHNRPRYLFEFLKSLEKVMGVMNTILVLSHDYYDEELNNFIKNIPFVTVIQIFYPYSKQLHPHVFPGNDKKYCKDGWQCVEDNDGLREVDLVQLKHHWWWKANYVFEKMDVLKVYNGLVVFLEEDQFVTEDFLFVLKVLDLARKNSCHRCDLVSVGAYPPVLSSYNINSTLLVEEFGSTPASMGIAFNRTTWNRIKKLRHYFCYYDDADWVASLRFLSSRLPEGRLNMLSIAGSRVIHFGKCGIQSSFMESDCDVTDKIAILKDFIDTVKNSLFPKHFVMKAKKRYTKLREDGNFGDVRDRELCMYFSK